jgi:hypothetical protein
MGTLRGNLIYVLWTILNVLQDSIFKYNNHIHFSFIFFIRYTLIFIISCIFNKIRNIPGQIPHREKKSLQFLNFFKSIVTLFAMIFVYEQIKINSLFSVNLIFFSIPLYDLIIDKIFSKNPPSKLTTFFYKNWVIILNNIIIIGFFINKIYYEGVDKIYYGFLGSLMFSISNILILKTEKTWRHKPELMSYDISWFSLYMIILSIFLIYYYKFNLNYLVNNIHYIWNFYFITYILLGVLIQFYLYYLFYKNDFTPSSILVSIDLIVALIFGFLYGQEKISGLEILIILIIMVTSFLKKYLFVNK